MTEPMDESEQKFAAGAPLVIITGLSGAGKSTAMRLLSDLGCYCLDNLPPALVTDFFALYEQSEGASGGSGVAIASDVRSGALFDDFTDMVKALEASHVGFEILYLDCSADTLISRFKEVRRNHPLQVGLSMSEAIDEERRRLEPIRAIATRIIDTSGLTADGLREAIIRTLIGRDKTDIVTVEFVSFGFKYGVPRDVDFVFDARFLPNPHYEPDLRAMTGEDQAVYDYVMAGPLADPYFNLIADIITLTTEPFFKVGKTNLTVGIGCTGGRHRSVAFARRLAAHFSKSGRRSVAVHRDALKSPT
jgi:UPF0042 nucleotide-binding protein